MKTGRRVWGAVALTALAGLFVFGTFIATYLFHDFGVPLGWDTPGYAWRTNVAEELGLREIGTPIPPPGPTNPGRPGFVTLASLLQNLGGGTPYHMAAVLPAVMAAAAGLAAGVLASMTLGRSAWVLAVVTVGVGVSPFLIHSINVEQYQDNALAIAISGLVVICASIATWDHRAILPAILFTAILGIVHWSFLQVMAAVLVIASFMLLPQSLRAWRAGEKRLAVTPSAGFILIALGGGLSAVLILNGLLGAELPAARLIRGQLVSKLNRDYPAYGLPLYVGAAMIGLWFTIREANSDSLSGKRARGLFALLLAWCMVLIGAFVGFGALHMALPMHRMLAFCIAIPLLAAIGLVSIGSLGHQDWRPLGVTAVILILGAATWWAGNRWFSFHPVMRGEQIRAAAAASGYLDASEVPVNRPIVFVVDDRGPAAWSRVWLEMHTLRAGMDPGRVAATHAHVGSVRSYLESRPDRVTHPVPGGVRPTVYSALSDSYFSSTRVVLRESPIALLINSGTQDYEAWVAANPQAMVTPGLAIVEGPPPTEAVRQEAARRAAMAVKGSSPSGVDLPILGLLVLVLLSVVGAGWTDALLGGWLRTWEATALAPAIGAATLILGGVALNSLGLPLNGLSAIGVVVIIALGGWMLALHRSLALRLMAGGLLHEAGTQFKRLRLRS